MLLWHRRRDSGNRYGVGSSEGDDRPERVELSGRADADRVAAHLGQPGRSPQIAAARRPLPDEPGSGRHRGQNRRTVLAVPNFSPGVNKVVPNVVSSALAAAPVRVRTIPLIRT